MDWHPWLITGHDLRTGVNRPDRENNTSKRAEHFQAKVRSVYVTRIFLPPVFSCAPANPPARRMMIPPLRAFHPRCRISRLGRSEPLRVLLRGTTRGGRDWSGDPEQLEWFKGVHVNKHGAAYRAPQWEIIRMFRIDATERGFFWRRRWCWTAIRRSGCLHCLTCFKIFAV